VAAAGRGIIGVVYKEATEDVCEGRGAGLRVGGHFLPRTSPRFS
jgi:hypothetical protein